jgi:eukaryotic-like serine/threonine-protein kinase
MAEAIDPKRWEKVERVFQQVLEADEDRRAEILEQSCAGDESLRREVESLLRHYKHAGTFIEDPAFAIVSKAQSAPTRRKLTGATIAHYRVMEEIGGGGMGVVYKAEDTKLGRIVALKFLPDHYAADASALERFHREARAASALNHPNICTIYDIEDYEGEQFIAMEYIEGRTVAELISARPLEVETIVKLGIQISEGLAAAHAKGIVHRDIKPGNIIVTASGLVKILDFGLAKLLQLDNRSIPTVTLTQTRAVSGTVPYMSPEQLRGRDVDLRSDIFALGAVLYEMATGRRPFTSEVLAELIDQILNSPPPAPRQLNGKLPEKLEEIILKCLEKDPEDRYQGAKEISVDMRRMIAPSTVTRTTAIARSKKSKFRLVWLAGAVAILAMSIAAWMLFRPGAQVRQVSTWEQITDFPDSATAPALSPDGRLLTFIRGPNTFLGPGEVYLKLMQRGEPLRLTDDDLEKRDPVFSPDGSRIVYTVGGPPYEIWTVPVTGGKSQLLMRNAASLTWTSSGRVMFAEFRQAIRSAIVSSTESRSELRDVYVPENVSGMAQRASLSPDAKWVLIAEMEAAIIGWLPCRLVPFEGRSAGRTVGPTSAPCTSAAWSPDGKWMYFSSGAGGSYHIWRQRFPNGRPEQVTFGPTHEEGIAILPDGRSLITSVGGSQSTFWLQNEKGEHQIDTAAAVAAPRFSSDGSKVFFVIRKQLRNLDQLTGELWVLDVESGNREQLLPGFAISDYDVSHDAKYVAVTVLDERGQANLWIASLDRHSPPRRIEWTGPITTGRFDPSGGLFVRATEGDHEFIYHVDVDGANHRKVIAGQAYDLVQVSPTGKWLIIRAPLPGGDVPRIALLAYPVNGGKPLVISENVWLPARWSVDGKFFLVTFTQDGGSGPMLSVAMVPVTADKEVPTLPATGLSSAEDIARLRGAYIVRRSIRTNDLAAYAQSPKLSTYAVVRTVVHRNLYRVPLPR